MMHPGAMAHEIVDLPDDVVANYMSRVRSMSLAAHRKLDVHLLDAFLDGVWLTHPIVMLMSPIVIYRSWMLIRGASWTLDAAAAHEYRVFFDELRTQGWTLAGRGRVALGILILRQRMVRPEAAFRAYRAGMDAFVPHQAIGWVVGC